MRLCYGKWDPLQYLQEVSESRKAIESVPAHTHKKRNQSQRSSPSSVMNQSTQAAKFQMTNIKVVKVVTTQGSSNSSSVPRNKKESDAGGTPSRVLSMFQNVQQQESSSLGPPQERLQLNNPVASLRNLSQELASVKSSNNMRQLTFGSVKKVVKAPTAVLDAASVPDQSSQGAIHKLYLPKKHAAPPQGIQLQEGHRRRLQALAAAQNGNQGLKMAFSAERDQQEQASAEREGFSYVFDSAGVSTQGTAARTKVISKKLITLSTQKPRGRNGAAAANYSAGDVGGLVFRVNHADSQSPSSRPAQLNLNFNTTLQGSGGFTVQTTTNNGHQQSALSRFNVNNPSVRQSALKQSGASVLQARQVTQLKKTNSDSQSAMEQQEQILMQTLHNPANINIRQEISPNRTAYNSQPAASRKHGLAHQGGSLCHRRHQIIQDITDEASPSAGAAQNSAGYSRHLAKQASESSMKSLQQLTQALNKQTDLKKVFYANINPSPSNKSLHTLNSNHSSVGPPSSQPSQQFALSKKASLISQEISASVSRERTLNFKLKKHGQHGQLQNQKEKLHNAGTIQIHDHQYGAHVQPVPSVANKRRPLVIRKNNFVLTKQNDSSSFDSNSNAPGSATNANSMTRVQTNPLTVVNQQSNKLNLTHSSNHSGHRALNNTQKIGLPGHGINSNDSLGSDASLSQPRAQQGVSVNTSILKAQPPGACNDASKAVHSLIGASASYRKLSDPGVHPRQAATTQRQIKTNSDLMVASQGVSKAAADLTGLEEIKEAPKNSQSQPSGSRLIKVNRSKKKLDTARRSRIQQLKDTNMFDSNNAAVSSFQSNQLSSTLQSAGRGIPQLSKNLSNAKLATHQNKQLLQVQTDFNATLPINIHKLTGSVTIKTEHGRKKHGSVEASEDHGLGDSSEQIKSVVQGVKPQQARTVRNSQNGLRPVRLFNYATTQGPSSTREEIQLTVLANMPQLPLSVKREDEQPAPLSLKGGQPTPTSASNKSQKSIRRGQIFRKQARKSMQQNEESSHASKENTTNGQVNDVLTHMTTPTDANVSSLQLPLKSRRSNAQRKVDSDKNQQSSYFQSSQGDQAQRSISKPDSHTNRSGNTEAPAVKWSDGKPFLKQPNQVLKQFDSDPSLSRPTQQRNSAKELKKMKNDHSELIVAKKQLASEATASAQLLIKKLDNTANSKNHLNFEPRPTSQITDDAFEAPDTEDFAGGKQRGDHTDDRNLQEAQPEDRSGKAVTKDEAKLIQKIQVQETVRRSLERVESIKNLLIHQDTRDEFDRSGAVYDASFSENENCLDDFQQKVETNNLKIETEAIFDKSKPLNLAGQFDSGRNSNELHNVGKLQKNPNANEDSIICSPASSHLSKDDQEPIPPEFQDELKNRTATYAQNKDHHNNAVQQDQLRIQHNETLPPPGPSASSSHYNGQVSMKMGSGQAQVNKLSVTKGSDLTRELMTQTADTSNRKTISNQRAYCNSSDSHVNVVGTALTAFSFKSQTSPDFQSIPQFPLTPQQTLTFYSNQLTDYERKEILEYPEIYFIGAPTAQKVQASAQLEYNFGYDDEKGDYKIITNDHIGFRFEIKSFLGKGSFGTALKCFDHKKKVEVAVKVVKNKKKYYYQAGVELKILQYLKENDPEDIMNVIHLNDYVIFRKHLCIGFELMSMNLFEFLKINDFNGFDHNLIRRFAIQLLYALKYLKMFQIIHCDLKPENILLKESNKSGIKIIDFGSSTFLDERVYTYIQSRFYRAPEIMLGIPYDCAIDMWSFGCIMAELYIGYPIFPGDSENDQMSRLMEMVGIPNPTVLSMSTRKDKFFTKAPDGSLLEPIMCKNSRGKLRKPMGKPLALVIGDEDPDFTDFVEKCLIWNPHDRLTPDDALKHVWILKGLPPQVLIHHQKMHNIGTPELPPIVLKTRNDFQREQQAAIKAQEQQQKALLSQKQSTSATTTNQATSASGERKIRLKRSAIQPPNTRNHAQQNFHTTNGRGRPTVLHPTQAVLQNGGAHLGESMYPGSTKASQRANAVGAGGKLSFKASGANNSNVVAVAQNLPSKTQTTETQVTGSARKQSKPAAY